MPLVHTLHYDKYNILKGRFDSNVFDNLGAGVSVFDYDCAIAKSRSICEHITAWYDTTTKYPYMYCVLQEDHLAAAKGFEDMGINHTLSDRGDDCHRDIINVKNSALGNYVKAYFKVPDLHLCCKGETLQVSSRDLARLPEVAEECKN